jgi:hypothetical protein
MNASQLKHSCRAKYPAEKLTKQPFGKRSRKDIRTRKGSIEADSIIESASPKCWRRGLSKNAVCANRGLAKLSKASEITAIKGEDIWRWIL